MAKNSANPDTDKIYATQQQINAFVFDERVAAVFPDMIQRSVPGYASIIAMIEILAAKHAHPGSRLYDLGCSLGAATAIMQSAVKDKDCSIVAVDNAPAMILRAQKQLAQENTDFICADIRDVNIQDASVVVLNFTLQFLPLVERQALLSHIRKGMRNDAILVLSEKIKGKNAKEDQVLTDLHHSFKKANGYSDLEISQKRTALENVLLPETIETHVDRLHHAGFQDVNLWFQCFNFVSFIACP